jgi:hypothetical protein
LSASSGQRSPNYGQSPSPGLSISNFSDASEPRIKQERNSDNVADSGAAALTQQDAHTIYLLRQMGFTDGEEIRQAVFQNRNAPADACMLWIISQREEAAEARKMDEARARSEELRQQAAEQRQKARQQQLDSTTLQQWSEGLFKTSIVLKHVTEELQDLRRDSQAVLVKFLTLEQKVRQWYKDVPWVYLSELAQQWKEQAPTAEIVKEVISELERGIYTLEQQEGGVPKLFLEKQREARKRGEPTGPSNNEENEDDEDIVVVLDEPPPPSKRIKIADTMPQEAIEIL